jgi:hypothetical protein
MSSFFEASGIEKWCRSADQNLREAFDTAHNRGTVIPMDWRLLLPSAKGRLLAVNAHSRIDLGRVLCEEIGGLLCANEHWEHEKPIFFGTFIPKAGLVDLGGSRIDLSVVKDQLRSDLRGLSYVGVIEPGLYASLPCWEDRCSHQAISWHCHTLHWDMSFDQISSLTRRLGQVGHYRAAVAELRSVKIKQVANGELPDVVGYLLKPPSHAYRVTRYPWVDQNGEIRLKPDGTPRYYVRQRASNLRKGERLRVFHAMKHLRLDELLVTGGEGSALRSRALRSAIKGLAH